MAGLADLSERRDVDALGGGRGRVDRRHRGPRRKPGLDEPIGDARDAGPAHENDDRAREVRHRPPPVRGDVSGSSCPVRTVNDRAVPLAVNGIPAAAGAPRAEVTPGTTSKGTPADASASASSAPRANTNGSPPFRRTTQRPRRPCSTRMALISSWGTGAEPGDLPTSMTSAPFLTSGRRGAARRSCTTTSATDEGHGPRTVMSSGSPGPAPTRWTVRLRLRQTAEETAPETACALPQVRPRRARARVALVAPAEHTTSSPAAERQGQARTSKPARRATSATRTAGPEPERSRPEPVPDPAARRAPRREGAWLLHTGARSVPP